MPVPKKEFWTEEQKARKILSNRKVSATKVRKFEMMSEEYARKRGNKLSVIGWGRKVEGKSVPYDKWLKKKLVKIVPREANYNGVLRK